MGISACCLAAPFLAAEGHPIREPVIASAYPLVGDVVGGDGRPGAARGDRPGDPARGSPLAERHPVVGSQPRCCAEHLHGFAYYAIGGLVVGLFTDTMDRAARGLRSANEEAARTERVARFREREALARTIHDSILQALAVVHRRGHELAEREHGTTRDIRTGLVDGQETRTPHPAALGPRRPPEGGVPLRTVLEAGGFGISGVDISVSTIEPALGRRRRGGGPGGGQGQHSTTWCVTPGASQATAFGEMRGRAVDRVDPR